MDPVLKQILDEIKTMKASVDDLAPLKTAVEELKASMTTRIDIVEKNLDDCFSAMENAVGVFDEWKPKVDADMEDLRVEIGEDGESSGSRSDSLHISGNLHQACVGYGDSICR
jgi:hypothetical protein